MSTEAKHSGNVAVEVDECLPKNPVRVPVQIDVNEVIEEFGSRSVGRSAVSDLNGFDLGVEAIAPHESAVVEVPPCPVCASRQSRPVFAIQGMSLRVVDCVDCGLGRLHPQPAPEQIAGFYPPEYYGATGTKFEPMVEALVRLVAARHVRALTRCLTAGARVLDVGCGRGVLLGAMADRGFEVHGFEISRTAAEGVDIRAEIRIAAQLVEAGYPDGYFDQVILWHVLEHISNPAETLREVKRILRRGGRLVVAVPNYSSLQARWAGPAWFHLDLPRHLFHFTLPALRKLIDDCGFDCLKEHHFSLRQNPFGWVQSALNRNRALPRNGLYTLLKQDSRSQSEPIDQFTCFRLRLAYLLGMPVGLLASLFAAIFRRGASIYITAESRPPERRIVSQAENNVASDFASNLGGRGHMSANAGN